MKLFEILKQQGLFSNEIKARVKNNQISINTEIVKSDIELDIETETIDEIITPLTIDPGDLLFDLIKAKQYNITQLKIFGLEGMIDSNIKNDLTEILNQFIFVRISKKETFLLKKKNNG